MKRPSINRQCSSSHIHAYRSRNEHLAYNTRQTRQKQSSQIQEDTSRGSKGECSEENASDTRGCKKCERLEWKINCLWKFVPGNIEPGMQECGSEKSFESVDGGKQDYSRGTRGIGRDVRNVELVDVGDTSKVVGKVPGILHRESYKTDTPSRSDVRATSASVNTNQGVLRKGANDLIQPDRIKYCPNKILLQSSSGTRSRGASTSDAAVDTIPTEQDTKKVHPIRKSNIADVLEGSIPLVRNRQFDQGQIRGNITAKGCNCLGKGDKGYKVQPVARIDVHSHPGPGHNRIGSIRTYAQVMGSNVPDKCERDGQEYKEGSGRGFRHTFRQERSGNAIIPGSCQGDSGNRRCEKISEAQADRAPVALQFKPSYHRASSRNGEGDSQTEDALAMKELFREYLRDMPQEKHRYTIVRTRRTTKLATEEDLKLPLHVKKIPKMDVNEIENMMNGSTRNRFRETLNTLLDRRKKPDSEPKVNPRLNMEDISHLLDARIVSRVSPEEENKRPSNQWVIPFTVVEPADDKGETERRRFIAWTKENNERIKNEYMPHVPLKHAAYYLHRAQEAFGVKRDLTCGFYQVPIPVASRTGEATERKHGHYVASGLISSGAFQCLPVLSSGGLSTTTRNLLYALADATVQNRKTVEADFKLLLQDLNGAAVYSQLRKYLASNGTENYGF